MNLSCEKVEKLQVVLLNRFGNTLDIIHNTHYPNFILFQKENRLIKQENKKLKINYVNDLTKLPVRCPLESNLCIPWIMVYYPNIILL